LETGNLPHDGKYVSYDGGKLPQEAEQMAYDESFTLNNYKILLVFPKFAMFES